MRFFYFHGNLPSALGSNKAKMFLCQGENRFQDDPTVKPQNAEEFTSDDKPLSIFQTTPTTGKRQQARLFNIEPFLIYEVIGHLGGGRGHFLNGAARNRT
jgi:hypothetical protein